jgi:hypothetical protein
MMNYLINMNRHLRITILLSLFFFSFYGFYLTVNGIFILIAFAFLGVLIASNVQHARHYSDVMEKTLEKALIKNDFVCDSSYLSDDFLSAIAISESKEKVAIFKRSNVSEELIMRLLNFKDIMECAIKEDGSTVTHSSKGSTVGNAFIGSVIAGGVGALIGAMVTDKETNNKIHKSTLTLVVDDLNEPIHEIHFLNSNMSIERDSEMYQNIYYEMNKWHKKISIILKRTELKSRSM